MVRISLLFETGMEMDGEELDNIHNSMARVLKSRKEN